MNKESSELRVRTWLGTTMGRLMRRYWVLVPLASEIAEADRPLARVTILGEKLLAFRDTQGRAGLVDEFCTTAARGVRHPLLISRLEIRHHRPVRGTAAGAATRADDEIQGISLH